MFPDLVFKFAGIRRGEIRIVKEHTGIYSRPIALALKETGFFVSVVNTILIQTRFIWSMLKVEEKPDFLSVNKQLKN